MLGTGFSDFAYADRERRDSNSYTTVWSTPSAELDDYNPYPQTMIPDDVPTPSTSRFQSPSSENMASVIDFDYSCLDGLDEKLLLNPMEAFAELCWMQAVEDYDDRSPTPTPTLSHPSLQRVPRYSDITMGSTVYHADEEDGDFQWHRKGLISGTSTPRASKSQCPVIPPFEFDGDRTSFILFESYFATTDLDRSMGSPPPYPGGSLPRHSLPSRIVSICSAFQGRLIRA